MMNGFIESRISAFVVSYKYIFPILYSTELSLKYFNVPTSSSNNMPSSKLSEPELEEVSFSRSSSLASGGKNKIYSTITAAIIIIRVDAPPASTPARFFNKEPSLFLCIESPSILCYS